MSPLGERMTMGTVPAFDDNQECIVVSVNETFSDGDRSVWPTHPRYHQIDPRIYLEKVATVWMKERGEFQKGKHYILNKLPEGFVLLARQRRSQSHIYDKFLYGHPSGGYYFSPNRFSAHFLYLMNGGATPCTCDLCKATRERTAVEPGGMTRPKGKPGRPPKALTSDRDARPGRPGRPGRKPGPKSDLKSRLELGLRGRPGRKKVKTYLAEDEEGTQDIFKELVYKLKEKGNIDETVTEYGSMDWRAERTQLRRFLTRTFMQHSFIPRLGEVVLWCPELEGEVAFDWDTDTFQMYSSKKEKFVGIPNWRAGTIAQVAEESIVLEDVLVETEKKWAVNMSGFRVETFPDPNSPDKSLSSQYKYVPLSHIRPFNYWDVFLQGVPAEDFHPSIKNALTIMSSFSMLNKYHFKGTWPDASIDCKGIYLGAELLIKGDGVRLVPQDAGSPENPEGKVTDVLVIDNIQLKLFSCDADLSSPHLSGMISPRLIGKIYTTAPHRAYRGPKSTGQPKPMKDEEVIESFECVGMRGYGPWYRLHSPEKAVEVTINQVIGRCFESEYMSLVFLDTSFGIDLEGVQGARKYSQGADDRIAPGKEWFCGDYRLQTLALETLNGIEAGGYDDARDLKMFRANLKIIDGTATSADLKDAKISRNVGRPPVGLIGGKTDSSKFENVGKISTLVSTALGPIGASANATPMYLTSAPDTGVDESDERGEGDRDNEKESESESDTDSDSGSQDPESSDEHDNIHGMFKPMSLGRRTVKNGVEYSDDDDPILQPLAKRRRQV